MNKRIISLLLATVLLCLILPVQAEEAVLKITTLEEFLTFAENCRLDSYSENLQVLLECDIDLTGTDFAGIPIFSGSFQGNDHTVSGFTMTGEGSNRGLFRYLTPTAQVKDLKLQVQLQVEGGNLGAVAGVNRGSIENCHVSGEILGGEYVGGIAGSNAVTGSIEGCTVEGSLSGDHFIGGIAGENSGVIRTCENRAAINTTPQQNAVEITDITMDALLNTEAVNTVTDIGGIAGASSGVIRECENRGDVGYPQMGYNVGGIAGTQSGYLVQCSNYGSVQGRKEVGGIVGQLEPAMLMAYSTDTLQILEGQLGTMSATVGNAAANAQTGAGELTQQMDALQGQVDQAQDALDVLTGSEVPDPDALLAAQNSLADALGAMPGTLQGIVGSGQALTSGLSRDLSGLYSQIQAMEKTIGNAKENLGGSFVDASDEDIPEDLTGKIESCVNSGAVLADLNVGGIAGAVSVETDMDTLEDWDQSGTRSLNFQSKLRAVILSCENRGTVTGKKQYAGGIVGRQSLGLVRQCVNTGRLDSAEATFVGGIAGESLGYLRNNHAKCEILADSSAGGIAGSGAVVTDCISMVRISGAREKVGAVLGEPGQEGSVAGNTYLVIDRDLGAVDGISYAGQAEPVALADLLAAEDVPELFKTVTVRFLFEDGTETTVSLVPGGSLTPEQIPQLPEKSGFTGGFGGLTETENILFDMTLQAEYTPHRTVIQSEGERPQVLVEGSFTDGAQVTVEKSDRVPSLSWGQTHLRTVTVRSPEGGSRLRLLSPEESDLLVLVYENGTWQEIACRQEGSYLVFDLQGTEMTVAVVRAADYGFLYYVLAGVLLAAAVVTVLLIRKHKKKEQ